MVSSSTDLHHRVADINKGDIIYAGMVAVHTRCLLYCLHVVCIWWTQVARGCLAEDFRYLSWFWNLVLVCSVSRSKRRAAHKISLGEQVRVEKSLCIALHRSSSCSNFHRLKTYILWGKIVWIKFAKIWLTIFISQRFGTMTFFKTDCLHTGQDENYLKTKVWWKQGESFHLPNYRN